MRSHPCEWPFIKPNRSKQPSHYLETIIFIINMYNLARPVPMSRIAGSYPVANTRSKETAESTSWVPSPHRLILSADPALQW